MTTDANSKRAVGITIVVVLAVLAVILFAMPDRRTGPERLGDAISELPNIDKAGNQLKDRSPAQQLGDKVEDVGENVKRSVEE